VIVGFLSALANFLPRLTVGASSSGQDPSTLSFTFTNTGVLPLENVKFSVALCDIVAGKIRFRGNGGCAYQEPPNCKWCMQRMSFDSQMTIDLRDVIDEINLPPEARMMPEGSRTGVRVLFQPWFFPITVDRHFPYALKRSNDGHFYWAPSDFTFEAQP
jgi:hypothetical protein